MGKIVLYYIDGMMNSEQMWSRPAMMITAFQILFDYFPLVRALQASLLLPLVHITLKHIRNTVLIIYMVFQKNGLLYHRCLLSRTCTIWNCWCFLIYFILITIMHQSRPLLQKGYYKEFMLLLFSFVFSLL